MEYYQVKHSKDGGNMVDSDDDFWKTLSNWIHLYEISIQKEQKTFFTKGRFILLTNKKPKNFLYCRIKDLRDGIINIDEVRACINNKLNENPSYKDILHSLYNIEPILLNQFLHKVEIKHFDNFLGAMYENFLAIHNNPSNADSIVKNLIGALWQYKHDCNGSFEFTGLTFRQKFKDILEKIAFNNTVTLDQVDDPDLEHENMDHAMVMVDQLKSIKIISDDAGKDDFSLSLYLVKFFKLKNALQYFYKIQLMTERSESNYDKIARLKWKSIFISYQSSLIQKDKNHEKISDQEKAKAGCSTFIKAMESPFEVAGQKTQDDLSEAWYLKLSNLWPPKIVWHFDWFKKHIEKS